MVSVCHIMNIWNKIIFLLQSIDDIFIILAFNLTFYTTIYNIGQRYDRG